MGHVVQVLLGYHLLVNPEEGSGQGHDGGGQLLLDQPVHHVGDVTDSSLRKMSAAKCLLTVSTNSLSCTIRTV